MTDKEFYMRLIESPCEGCSAYEEIGHCGTWSGNCIIFDLLMDLDLNLLPFLGWDRETFLSYIFYKEDEEVDFIIYCEDLDAYYSSIEDAYDDYYGNLY